MAHIHGSEVGSPDIVCAPICALEICYKIKMVLTGNKLGVAKDLVAQIIETVRGCIHDQGKMRGMLLKERIELKKNGDV